MAVRSQQVTVDTTADRLDFDQADATYSSGSEITVRNTDASISVFLGPSTVTSSTGFELLAGYSFSTDLSAGEKMYAVAASGSVRVDVIQEGV